MINQLPTKPLPPPFGPVTVTFTIETKEELTQFIRELGSCHGTVTGELYRQLYPIE
jgi:hypothetical protein